ncbi:MAG: MBL fold metallo-hydrolase [Deltaproteobacteria bacterium]|nr:MAG: MBL fold metallo-hydrolase [Deltaproteobacteria bacterium]HEX15806.1 MBL fold metallo-hydrolase [Deltaproteobacteria bacterium]
MELKVVKDLKVTILVDNYIDVLLPSSEGVVRPPVAVDGRMAPNPVAEHGLSLLVEADGERLILDFGLSRHGLLYNLEVLGISPEDISCGVVSHGHHDHLGALFPFLERARKPFPLYVHPDAFLPGRFIRFPSGQEVAFPPVQRHLWQERGAEVHLVEGPRGVLGGKVLVSGEIPRVTDFEKGLPGAFWRDGEREVADHLRDDMSLYLLLDGKGLVVLSGCAHAGIVNSVLYGMELTGADRVHLVAGGFHLTGPGMEEALPKTIARLKELRPRWICPMHCTGWRGQRLLEDAFGGGFILSSSGSTLVP